MNFEKQRVFEKSMRNEGKREGETVYQQSKRSQWVMERSDDDTSGKNEEGGVRNRGFMLDWKGEGKLVL